MKEVSHGNDGNISLKNLENCINSDLANNYGNLCQRVFSFIKNNCKNKINKLLPNALFPEHESELSCPALVACLGRRLDFAISIDNGVMHMLSLSKVPMITLFGPTDSEKFAPKYKSSIILDSKSLSIIKLSQRPTFQ